MGRSPTKIRSWALMETVMRSSGSVSGWLATGSDTSMPRLIMGAVTMKTRSSTSTTSTSGVTLISPRAEEVRWLRSPRYVAAAWEPPSVPPACMLREVTLDDVEEFQREVVHHRRQHLDAGVVEVVEHRGGDGRAEPGRGGDEGLGDAGGDHRQVGRAGATDRLERVHDPPHGAEQADEGRHGGGRGEEAHPPLQARRLHGGRAGQGAGERVEALHGRAGGRRHVALRSAAHLLVHLQVTGLEHSHERARLELETDGVDLRELAALAEDLQERLGLAVGKVQRDALVDDDGPGDQGEEHEHDQHALAHASDL